MTKTLIGLDYTGTACIKITKGAFDPATTSDAEISKFYYSSKWAADCKVNAIRTGATGTSPRGYYPSASSWTWWSSGNGDGGYQDIYKKSYFTGLIYDLPLYDRKRVDANGFYTHMQMLEMYFGTNDRTQVWKLGDGGAYLMGWAVANATYTFTGYFGATVKPAESSIWLSGTDKLVVWQLPGDETAIQNGTPQAAVSGQPQIIISSTDLRVSKPGFDVNTATGSQLAFSSSQIPAKVIAAADIAVPKGTTYFDCGMALPTDTIIECHFYASGQPIYFPCHPNNGPFGATFRANGNTVEFSNPNGACRARVIVFAEAPASATSGANNVLRQFDQNGQQVVQFLRPGAGASPGFGDIVIDSRWPALQIVKEGYLSITTGNQANTISYDASGMFTFIKWCTVHGSGTVEGGSLSINTTKFVRTPRLGKYRTYNDSWGSPSFTGDTSYVQYTDTGATFYTFRGNPLYVAYYNQSGGGVRTETVNDPAVIIGLRYYVFGVALP
ncbi:hypothetical protein ACQZ4X_11440 [Agrobacterium vitis]